MMEELQPKVLLLRVQNSIKKVVSQLYSTEQENIVRAVLLDGSTIFFDLKAKKIVPGPLPDVSAWGKEDTDKLTGGKQAETELNKNVGKYHEIISRDDLSTDEETVKPKADKPKKAGAKKATNTKKTK